MHPRPLLNVIELSRELKIPAHRIYNLVKSEELIPDATTSGPCYLFEVSRVAEVQALAQRYWPLYSAVLRAKTR